MNGPFIFYEKFGRSFFRLITIHVFVRWTDRQTDISALSNTGLHKKENGRTVQGFNVQFKS